MNSIHRSFLINPKKEYGGKKLLFLTVLEIEFATASEPCTSYFVKFISSARKAVTSEKDLQQTCNHFPTYKPMLLKHNVPEINETR